MEMENIMREMTTFDPGICSLSGEGSPWIPFGPTSPLMPESPEIYKKYLTERFDI